MHVILAADVPALEALCAIEDCLAHPIVVEFVFFFLIAVPKELALSSLKLTYSDKASRPIHEIGIDGGSCRSYALMSGFVLP